MQRIGHQVQETIRVRRLDSLDTPAPHRVKAAINEDGPAGCIPSSSENNAKSSRGIGRIPKRFSLELVAGIGMDFKQNEVGCRARQLE